MIAGLLSLVLCCGLNSQWPANQRMVVMDTDPLPHTQPVSAAHGCHGHGPAHMLSRTNTHNTNRALCSADSVAWIYGRERRSGNVETGAIWQNTRKNFDLAVARRLIQIKNRLYFFSPTFLFYFFFDNLPLPRVRREVCHGPVLDRGPLIEDPCCICFISQHTVQIYFHCLHTLPMQLHILWWKTMIQNNKYNMFCIIPCLKR